MPVSTKSDTSPPERYYTTAPTDYDWGWTKTLTDNVAVTNRGKTVRLVEISDGHHADYQVSRYGSGMHFAITEEEYLKQARLGLLTPTPDKAIHYFRKDFDLATAFDDAAKTKKLAPYVMDNRYYSRNIHLEAIGGSTTYRLTVKGSKDEAEATFNRLVSEIEAILNG